MRIIVVDDKEEERYLAETLLKGSGYEVETAVNGAEALEKLRAEGFDMIVSDVLMPVMDGFRLCRECKGDEKLKDIPFIFYTATYKDEKDEELASKVGADRFILKPIEPEEFVKLIQSVFRDVEEGKIGPKRRVLEEEKEVLKLYSERLIEKLEKKMLDLERDITERKQAEEALTESEEKYRTLFESMLNGFAYCKILVDENNQPIDFVHLEVNNAWERLIGLKREDVIGKRITEVIPGIKEAKADLISIYGKVALTGQETKCEFYFEPLEKWFTVSVYSPQKGYFVAIFDEITERKQAEEMLRESEKNLIKGQEIGKMGYWKLNPVTQDVEGSDELFKIFELGHDELTLNAFADVVHPEDREYDLEHIQRGIEKGVPWDIEHRLLLKNGNIKWIRAIGELNLDENGKVIQIIGIVQDITEHKQAEEEIRESEEKYRTLFELGSDALLLIEVKTGKILDLNNAAIEMYGYSREEALQMKNTDFSAEPDKTRKATLESEKHIPVRYHRRKDGTIFPTDISVAYYTWYGKEVCVAAIRDTTERKQAEEKERELQVLREVDSLRSQLLANISHELRTPLTSIKGFAATLLRTDVEWSEEEQRDYLQTIDQESNRLIRLISDLLDMSRLEAGGLKLDKDNYQISEILDAVSSRLASLTERHQLQMIIPSGLPSVFVDQMRIGQVLTNLVENAAKYSTEGSQITVGAKLAGDEINISVTDRGQGIAPELLPRVFDRFYQAESIVSGRKSGTGLGLSICKGIIESHGGRIWMESKLGEGSKFSFSLPVGKGREEIA